MPNPLFSTYKQGENRVTSTILAVFEQINLTLLEDVLEVALDESDIGLLQFQSQPQGVESVPDAAIRSSVSIHIETKTSEGAVDADQLRAHLATVEDDDADFERLIVLTPDYRQPEALSNVDDDRIIWINFDTLVDSIEAILERDIAVTEEVSAVPTEREAFLLRELVRFLYDEELVSGAEDRILVVAARNAWPEYEAFKIYFCQPNRSFRPSEYLAFYTKGEIKPEVPKITEAVEQVELSLPGIDDLESDISEERREELRRVINTMREFEAPGHHRLGTEQKVLFLDPSQGFELDKPVKNDKTAEDTARRIAFVRGHRYVSANDLRDSPDYTSALE